MDWVHCNTCFTSPSEKIKFGLTSCGHIYCEKCISNDKKCKTCGQTYSGLITLSNQMKPDVQMYFMDIKDVCKNLMKQVQQVQQVSEFQKGHTQRLLGHRKHQLSKASDMMSQARELDRKYRIVCKENDAMKKFITSLGYKLTDVLPDSKGYPLTPGKMSMSANAMAPPKTPNTPSNGMLNKNKTPVNMRFPSPSTRSMQLSPAGGTVNPSPMKTDHPSNRPSPSNSLYGSPMGNGKMLRKTSTGPSPIQRSGNNMVTPGRLSVRTPPVNGRIGSISPMGSSPRLSSTPHPTNTFNRGNTGSRISQSLSTLKKSPHPYNTPTPQSNEKRPLHLNNPRGSFVNRR